MKKTVTTILSLALAMILVSSLGNGVTLAKGPSDNASDRGKERARYHKVRDVGILECSTLPATPGAFEFFDGPDDITLPDDAESLLCVPNLNFLLNTGWRIEGLGTFFVGGVVFERYTVVRTRRERRE